MHGPNKFHKPHPLFWLRPHLAAECAPAAAITSLDACSSNLTVRTTFCSRSSTGADIYQLEKKAPAAVRSWTSFGRDVSRAIDIDQDHFFSPLSYLLLCVYRLYSTAVVAKALTPAAKVQDEIQENLINGLREAAKELGELINAAIEKLPADLKEGLVRRLNTQ